MPYTVVYAWYPPDRVDDVVNVYMKVMEKFPVDESVAAPVIPGAVSSTKKGISTITISEVKPQKLDEAVDRLNQSMVMFHSVTDYRYEVKIMSTFFLHLTKFIYLYISNIDNRLYALVIIASIFWILSNLDTLIWKGRMV